MSSVVFVTEQNGPVLVVVPQRNVSSLADEDLQNELENLLSMVGSDAVQHVLIDYHHVPYFGSTMLEVMRRLWSAAQPSGKLAVCGLSKLGSDILHVTRFDTLWPAYASREEALQYLK